MSRELWSGDAIVYGPPASMGSKRAFNTKSGRAIVVDVKAKKLRSFQSEMRDSMRETKPDSPLLGPVQINLRIVMRRPQSHFGTGKNAGVLKANAPRYCTTKPDFDKVWRAVCDCGTGIWFRDDSQLCCGGFEKRYAEIGEEEHVQVCARELEDAWR